MAREWNRKLRGGWGKTWNQRIVVMPHFPLLVPQTFLTLDPPMLVLALALESSLMEKIEEVKA